MLFAEFRVSGTAVCLACGVVQSGGLHDKDHKEGGDALAAEQRSADRSWVRRTAMKEHRDSSSARLSAGAGVVVLSRARRTSSLEAAADVPVRQVTIQVSVARKVSGL